MPVMKYLLLHLALFPVYESHINKLVTVYKVLLRRALVESVNNFQKALTFSKTLHFFSYQNIPLQVNLNFSCVYKFHLLASSKALKVARHKPLIDSWKFAEAQRAIPKENS